MDGTNTRTLTVERSTSTAHRLLHYDGVCGNIHGHNFDWHVTVTLSMEGTGNANMPLDLKTIADCLDQVDHATLLNAEDPLADEDLGQTILFEQGDPTCEVVAQQMAEWIHHLSDAIQEVDITVYETQKYGVSATYATSNEA
jgi:6-pyruvoyltetrahydropterin/6-carboxytetrahydropterin synthase